MNYNTLNIIYSYGKLEIFKWLKEENWLILTENTIDILISYHRYDVLTWLQEQNIIYKVHDEYKLVKEN